jgi:hypothetical protein
MSMRKYVKFTAIVAMLLCGLSMVAHAAGSGKTNKQQPPNIIIFLVDDMGLMDTSVPMLTDEHGKPQRHPLNDWYRTPNMERLANQAFGLVTSMPIHYAHLPGYPYLRVRIRRAIVIQERYIRSPKMPAHTPPKNGTGRGLKREI